MVKLNGGKKKRFHNYMDASIAKKYLRQHIELFGDELYGMIDDSFISTSRNLDFFQEHQRSYTIYLI